MIRGTPIRFKVYSLIKGHWSLWVGFRASKESGSTLRGLPHKGATGSGTPQRDPNFENDPYMGCCKVHTVRGIAAHFVPLSRGRVCCISKCRVAAGEAASCKM